MNLLQIRQKFRELSGRYDLVDNNGDDNGANFFINEGRKFLDRLDETQKSWASCFRMIEPTGFSTSFPFCRAIKEVWVATIEARWQLKKLRLQDLMANYLNSLPESSSPGAPLYYSPCITRYIPENATVQNIESFTGYVQVPSGNALHYNTILLNVPTSRQLAVTITGLFYSHELAEDEDTNYWSEVHPMLLIMATMRQVEIVNRNTQGVNDWTNAILTETSQLGLDLVEEMIAEIDQMEG